MRLLALHALPALIAATIAGNALLAGWAFASNLRRAGGLSRAFWAVLLVVLALVALQAASGFVLAVGGARPRTGLHILYGVLVAATAVVQFGLRPGGFLRPMVARDPTRLREPRYLALICLTQAALLLRAYTTGAFGR